ncbi:UDP-N-acetylglucosamine transporter-like [Haliotis cracherodii]|uniref:UDP-N-acetylglucosamine transporter-like n=1 Tax=Haliotis cracherodii TaxID=6455 RepID=UPI0039ECFD13
MLEAASTAMMIKPNTNAHYRISYTVEQLLATDVDARTPSEQSSPLQTDVLYLSLSYNQSSWSTEKTIEDPQEMSLSLKVTMLTLLSCANASVVVLTHYVRTRKGAMFSASSAVLMAELLKVGACLLAMFIRRPSTWLSNVYSITLGGLREWARVAVPAMLYAVQNNLVFFALSNLNSVVFQVTYQLKILTTALFSVLLLQKTLTFTQWLSLMLLFAGVAVTQIKGDHSRHTPTAHHAESMALAAVIGASILSGFASVYFEKILKGGGQSIWERNIQLGIPGALCATVTLLVKDSQYLVDRGFFYGYDSWVWLAILLQSLGGLLVAFVVKVMDNILKTFAMALAILLSCAASFFLFHTGITIQTLPAQHTKSKICSAIFEN